MKITFSKSEPFKSGWRGWADYVDVFVDGKMEYEFSDRLGQMRDSPRSGVKLNATAFGIKAAKAAVIRGLT